MNEFTIELKQLYFFSFHGLYEEEKKVGSEFVVDLFAKYYPGHGTLTSIEETVNYAALYEIVKAEMGQPKDLLETVAQSVAEKINQSFPLIKEIEIRIEKKNPPIDGFSGSVAVIYRNVN
jgi:dihydroneopterin aldolase